MISWLLQRSPRQGLLLGIGLILWIGLTDVLTGYELRFGVFYLIPIFLMAWTAGRNAGVLASFLSALCSLLDDQIIGHPPERPLVAAWSLLATFCIYIVMVFLLTRLKEALQTAERLARSDSLTGLANSRAFYEAAERESARCRRQNLPLTLIYLDCDGFKTVNDTLGHQAGDAVLRVVAETLQANVRESDIVARLGGDEFAVLLSDVSASTARAMSSRLRTNLLEGMRQYAWPVTFSIGVASFTAIPESVDDMVRCTDELMYTVKQNGKDNIAYIDSR